MFHLSSSGSRGGGKGVFGFEDDFSRAFPRQLQHASKGVGLGAADSAGSKEVARLHVASRHGVVHQLLLHIPVHVLEVGARDHSRGFHVFSLNLHLEGNVIRAVVRVLEVWQWDGAVLLAGRGFAAERLKSVQGHHPRRDRGGEVFGPEGPQRYVLPLLNVARRPIVHEHEAKYVFFRVLHAQRLSRREASPPHEKRHLQLEVKQPARPVRAALRRVGCVFLELPRRPNHIYTAHEH
mmetsp:Transcript_15676/g.32170  ORF Transcript_15676/g.32170 Transcript_15676/m.32170 type:complete len:237 (+) Transcript_15676:404-1114(+)